MIYGIMVLNLGLTTRTIVFVDEYLTPHQGNPEALKMYDSESGLDFYVSSLRGSIKEMRKISKDIQIEILNNSRTKVFGKEPLTEPFIKENFELKIKLLKQLEDESNRISRSKHPYSEESTSI